MTLYDLGILFQGMLSTNFVISHFDVMQRDTIFKAKNLKLSNMVYFVYVYVYHSRKLYCNSWKQYIKGRNVLYVTHFCIMNSRVFVNQCTLKWNLANEWEWSIDADVTDKPKI